MTGTLSVTETAPFVWAPLSRIVMGPTVSPARPDTVHAAGCSHLRFDEPVNALTATSAGEACREIASRVGWDTYPHEADRAFAIVVASCVEAGTAEPAPTTPPSLPPTLLGS